MACTGKCSNFSGCLLALRREIITIPDDAPFICPECKFPLIKAAADGRKPIFFPAIILGGLTLLVVMSSIAISYQVMHLKQAVPAGQIGTSFEQAEVAASHGEFLPSRHMVIPATPSPSPAASPLK
jgi:hypothetical protein